MPWVAEALTKKSNIKKVKDAISKTVGQCMDEGGHNQDQCVAIAYSMAREATGRELKK